MNQHTAHFETELSVSDPSQPDLPMNCWLTRDFSPLKIVQTLQTQLNEGYRFVDQTGFYIDPLGSHAWCNVSRQKTYQDIRRSLSYSDIATHIAKVFQKRDPTTEELDIFVLGPGEGLEEAILIQNLASHFKMLRVFMVEASDPLLKLTIENATRATQYLSNVKVYAVSGDFYDLWRYIPMVSPGSKSKKRLVVALTILYNMPDELSFIRNNLACLDSNDMFLFDFFRTAAPIEDTEAIKSREVRLRDKNSSTGWDHALDEWHRGIIRRYCNNVKEMQFRYELTTEGCSSFPDSYAVDKVVDLLMDNGSRRSQTIQRFKRYAPGPLVYKLQREGWLPIHAWHFGKLRELIMYLFRKK